MSSPEDFKKASFIEILEWDKETNKPKDLGETVGVQFNPQTLKVSYANQLSGGDKNGAASRQFVGRGTTKLSLDLWFDVTVPSEKNIDDVRLLTKKIVDFIKPKDVKNDKKNFKPPGVRFIWGTFMFDGIVESINENLEFFSEHGKPLRASISLSIGSQEIQFHEPPPGNPGQDTPGKKPLHQTKENENMPAIASKNGISDWKAAAMAAGIENPRIIPPGTMLDLNKVSKISINVKLG